MDGHNCTNYIRGACYQCADQIQARLDAALLQISDLKNSMEDVNRTLKHDGLEPWPDGRSVYDGKRPWEQHIAMVITSLKAQLDSADRLNCLLRPVIEAVCAVADLPLAANRQARETAELRLWQLVDEMKFSEKPKGSCPFCGYPHSDGAAPEGCPSRKREGRP